MFGILPGYRPFQCEQHTWQFSREPCCQRTRCFQIEPGTSREKLDTRSNGNLVKKVLIEITIAWSFEKPKKLSIVIALDSLPKYGSNFLLNLVASVKRITVFNNGLIKL